MRIKILRTVGKKDTLPKSNDNPNSLELPAKPDGGMFQEGEVADLNEEDAQKFLACGVGEQAQPETRNKASAEVRKPETPKS